MLTLFAHLVQPRIMSKQGTDAASSPNSLSIEQLFVSAFAIIVAILLWSLAPVLKEWYQRRRRNGLGDGQESYQETPPGSLRETSRDTDPAMETELLPMLQQEGHRHNATVEITLPPQAHL